MKRTPAFTLLFLTLGLTGSTLFAEEKEAAHIKVGDPVPNVILHDADGEIYNLRENIAKQPAVLIF